MDKYTFENHGDLSGYMADMAQDGYSTIAVLFYDDAIKLMRELMYYEDISVDAIDIQPYPHKGYDREYYVTLADDLVLSVEPAYYDDRYLMTDADIILVSGKAHSSILKVLDNKKCRELEIDLSEDIWELDFDKLIDFLSKNPAEITFDFDTLFDWHNKNEWK